METGFIQYHPFTQFLFFASVISVTMLIMHPVILGISFLTAAAWMLYGGGWRALRDHLKLTLITSVMIILVNPLISHNGVTILTYLPDGNPFTLESVYFGIGAAVMLSCTLKWFSSVNRIFTSDKIICLFGGIAPKLALLISMTLSFIDQFRVRLRAVKAAQKNLGFDTGRGTLRHRILSAVRIFSVMVQWSLEHSVDTADAMKSKGYGLKRRTHYTLYRMLPRDYFLLFFILLCDAVMITAVYSGALEYSYYPCFSIEMQGGYTIVAYLLFLLLCLAPLIIDVKEDRKWKSIRSSI